MLAMHVNKNQFMGVAQVLLFCGLFSRGHTVHLKLDNNYLLDYYLLNNDQWIEFQIQAINVTGWVGIGVNNLNANMDGADLFIGGNDYLLRGEYGYDMHRPVGAGNGNPVNDTQQDWKYDPPYERNGSTFLTVRRPLISPDKQQDTDIVNATINLLWAFHPIYDQLIWQHVRSGSHSVNLLIGSAGGVPTTTGPPTTTPSSASWFNKGIHTMLIVIILAIWSFK